MRPIVFLEAHWLAVALLGAAVLLVGGSFLAGRAWRAVWRSLAAAFALFALGGLTLTGRAFDSFVGRVEPAWWLLYSALAGLMGVAALLVFARRWSRWVFLPFVGLGLVGLGGILEAPAGDELNELGRALKGLHFVRPWWLLLLTVVPAVVLFARRSLSGLGPVRKWVAIGARAAVVTLLVCALAEPRFRRPTDAVTVLFVIDRSDSVPTDVDVEEKASDRIDRRWQTIRGFVDGTVRNRWKANRRDQAGVVLFGKRPKLALPPAATTNLPIDDRMAGPIDGSYSDLAAALKLAVASFPEGSGRRIVLVSDGNENIGNAEEQAAVARQNGVVIDCVALAPGYRNENDVLVQAIESPPVTAAGTRLPVRVLVRNASPDRVVDGLLELIRVSIDADGRETTEAVPVDAEQVQVLETGDGKRPPRVRLEPGLNAFRFRDKPAGVGDRSFAYRATFTPIRSANRDGSAPSNGLALDRIANNRATTSVVSAGQRQILFVEDPKDGKPQHPHLLATLRKAKLKVVPVPVDSLPQNKNDFTLFLSNYDSVVLANVPAEKFTQDQMEALKSNVHDLGCGLVMVGGPDSYGPGGYQGTPVEAALPVDCEIKAIKAAGKGGLILIMHASEMADGNKWQKDIAKLAIQRLNPQDMVGVLQYGFVGGAGVSWVIPFTEIGGNKGVLLSKIDGMTPGDMPDFDPFLRKAVDTLTDPDHGLSVKHCIVISDGDPQYGAAGRAAVQKMADNQVTCTTVGVATHGVNEDNKMSAIAKATKDGKGQTGNFYKVTDPAQLPAIYIKESRRVSQSFIYDKPFNPKLVLRGGPTEGLTTPLPDLRGFVRTSMKENTLAEMRIEGPRVFDQQFPILASWQFGLGKAVAFTSDARTVPDTGVVGWDEPWAGSDVYQKFWEQAVSWSMRAAEKGSLTVQTQYRDGRVKVTVDARDDGGKPVSGLDMVGGLSLPKAPAAGEQVPQLKFKPVGGGRYEAEFPALESGSYFLSVDGYRPGPGGKLGDRFDGTRAGVTVPYSPEFADLESNTPLMKRLAEATGGNFYTDDKAELERLAQSGELYRPTPKTAGALTPFWYWLVFAAGLMLLFDVGVRRVSVEWVEVRAAATRVWTKLRTAPDEQAASAELDRLRRRKVEAAEAINRERAARRFDVTGAPPPTAAPAGADEVVRADRPTVPPPPLPSQRPSERPAAEEDTFSKLRKAKQRARDKIDRKDEDKPPT